MPLLMFAKCRFNLPYENLSMRLVDKNTRWKMTIVDTTNQTKKVFQLSDDLFYADHLLHRHTLSKMLIALILWR